MKLRYFQLFILTFLFAGQSAFAQVAKKIIVEHFTNSRCSICASSSKNPAFYTNLANFPDALHISYHPSSPYSDCFFSQHNPEENDDRTKYYDVYGATPRLVVQGIVSPTNVAFGNPELFTQYMNQTTEISLSIKQTKITDQSIESEVTITTEAAHNYTDVEMLVGVAEKVVNYNAPNGEQEHHDVFRKATTPISGEIISLPAVGDSITLTYSFAHNSDWDFSQMFTYAILNDGTNKQVIQSVAASPSDTNNPSSANEVNTIENLEIYPNPVNDLLNINLESGETSTAQLYDVYGRLIDTETFTFQTQLNFANHPKGIYFLEVKNKEGKALERIIHD